MAKKNHLRELVREAIKALGIKATNDEVIIWVTNRMSSQQGGKLNSSEGRKLISGLKQKVRKAEQETNKKVIPDPNLNPMTLDKLREHLNKGEVAGVKTVDPKPVGVWGVASVVINSNSKSTKIEELIESLKVIQSQIKALQKEEKKVSEALGNRYKELGKQLAHMSVDNAFNDEPEEESEDEDEKIEPEDNIPL